MANTPNLDAPELTESQAGKATTLNESLRILDGAVQCVVIDKDDSEPPSGPSDGDRYIVDETPSSASDWAGQDNKIAHYVNTAWEFITPLEGWRAFVQDEDEFYVYLGASLGWVKESSLVSILDLADTPSSMSGQAYKALRVVSGESSLEFTDNDYDVHAYVDGTPGASEVMARFPFVRSVRFADDFAGSQAKAGTAAGDSAGAEFLIKKNGTEFGQMTFANGATTATFATDSGLEDFAAGDYLEVVAPATPDSTLAGVSFILKGFKI